MQLYEIMNPGEEEDPFKNPREGATLVSDTLEKVKKTKIKNLSTHELDLGLTALSTEITRLETIHSVIYNMFRNKEWTKSIYKQSLPQVTDALEVQVFVPGSGTTTIHKNTYRLHGIRSAEGKSYYRKLGNLTYDLATEIQSLRKLHKLAQEEMGSRTLNSTSSVIVPANISSIPPEKIHIYGTPKTLLNPYYSKSYVGRGFKLDIKDFIKIATGPAKAQAYALINLVNSIGKRTALTVYGRYFNSTSGAAAYVVVNDDKTLVWIKQGKGQNAINYVYVKGTKINASSFFNAPMQYLQKYYYSNAAKSE